MVDIKSDGSYSRVYLNDKIGRIEKELFKIVRQKTPRHILLAFLSYFVCSQSDLSNFLEKHPKTISRLLRPRQVCQIRAARR